MVRGHCDAAAAVVQAVSMQQEQHANAPLAGVSGTDIKLLHVARHAREGALLLGVPVEPDVSLNEAACTPGRACASNGVHLC